MLKRLEYGLVFIVELLGDLLNVEGLVVPLLYRQRSQPD